MRIHHTTLLLVAAAFFASPRPTVADELQRFAANEITIIAEYFSEHGYRERGKRKSLPPGIAKNLARGKSLPPGIAKRRLPRALVRQLPPAPDGYERVIIDGKVLLVEIATQVVHDVLMDVIVRK